MKLFLASLLVAVCAVAQAAEEVPPGAAALGYTKCIVD